MATDSNGHQQVGSITHEVYIVLRHNVKWVSLSQCFKISCQLLGLVVFARYLTPEEIGVMSLTLVVVNFVNILRDMGSSAAIIQRVYIDDRLKNSVFVFNVLIGCFLFFIFYFLSNDISSFFKKVELAGTIKAISFAFIFNSVTSVHLALLERASKFKVVAIIESFSSIISLLFGIALAIKGFGVYSLVGQTLMYSLLTSIMFHMFSGWKPALTFDFRDIKSIFNFSSNIVAFNFVNFFSRNSDQIIIGKFFSASILGQYSMAYKVMLFPIQSVTAVLTRSLYPVLSRLQESKQDALSAYLNVLKVISLVVTPMMLGLSSVSHELVNIAFGKQWVLLPNLLTWLSIVGILQAMVSTTGSVFMSQGDARTLFIISVFNSILQVGSFIIGVNYNIETLVILYMIANFIMFLPNMYLSVKTLNGSILDVLRCVYKPVFSGVIMFISIKVLSCFSLHFSNVSFLLIKIGFGFLVYTSLILFLDRKLVKMIFKM
ncbi:lipopolysaccharide biosynthesis protein [Klebsiella pneumoniae]|uniref:lipopolysaccharide biosynthesis protein n=1 Tax=Klebsiella pneumoniae TaxID=573 RepID=UPI003A972FFC